MSPAAKSKAQAKAKPAPEVDAPTFGERVHCIICGRVLTPIHEFCVRCGFPRNGPPKRD